MNTRIKHIKKNLILIVSSKRYRFLFSFFIIFIASFFLSDSVFAQEQKVKPGVLEKIWSYILYATIGFFLEVAIKLVGHLLTLGIYLLHIVVGYNDFINTTVVTVGWETVRDIANIFFVLILLAIAIGTILNQENYHYKRALPRMVIMAIVINFSKVICGLIIDVAQLFAFQFVHIIKTIGPQQLFVSLGITRMFTIIETGFSQEALTAMDFVLGLGVGLIFLIIALIVVGVYLLIFVSRIVALWILIVLSPLAFFLAAWPSSKAQGYAKEWWDYFLKYVFIGPVLAFFLWLAFTATARDGILNLQSTKGQVFKGGLASEITSPENLARFIVTIGLLIVGLVAASRAGVAGSELARSAIGKMKGVAQKAALFPGKFAWGRTKWAGRYFDETAVRPATRWFLQKTPVGKFLTGAAREEKRERKREEAHKNLTAEKGKQLALLGVEKDLQLAPHRLERTSKMIPLESQLQGVKARREQFEKIFSVQFAQARTPQEREALMKDKERRLEEYEKNENDVKLQMANAEEVYKSKTESIEQAFAPRKEKIEGEHAQKEAAIDQQYAYKRGFIRKTFARGGKSGISGNLRLWREGYKNQRARVLKDYELGTRGQVHDIFDTVTTFGKKYANYERRESSKAVNEEQKALHEATDGHTEQVVDEFFEAVASNDALRIAAAWRELASNVDLNEVGKGKEVERLQPVFEKALRERYLGKTKNIFLDANGNRSSGVVSEQHIQDIMKKWKEKGTVNPAVIASVMHHTLLKAYKNEDIAARESAIISGIALSKGQGITYGSEQWDSQKKSMKFVDMDIQLDESGNVGNLEYGREAANALASKLKNSESRRFGSIAHPDLFAIEDYNGRLRGLSAQHKMIYAKFLPPSLIRSTRERPHESRSDRIMKLAESKEFLRDMPVLANELKEFPQRYDLTPEEGQRQAGLILDFVDAIKESATKAKR